MEEESAKQVYESSTIRQKYPCYNYAIRFIEADTIAERKIGYSLLAPIFQRLPIDLQEYIRYIWEIDSEKRRMPYKFVKCCEKIFVGEN